MSTPLAPASHKFSGSFMSSQKTDGKWIIGQHPVISLQVSTVVMDTRS